MNAPVPPDSSPVILAFGEPMIEYNEASGDGRFLRGFGGDTSNFAVAAARQGARAGYLSAVGEDAHGAMLLALWDAEGVDRTHVRVDPEAPTGVYFVTHDAGGHRFDFLRAGSAASRYRPADLPLAAIRAARALHLSGISLAISASACDAGFAAAQAARAAGVLVSFDTNLRRALWPLPRARATMAGMIALADVCLPSLDDVAALLGTEDEDAILDALLGMMPAAGPRIVALKLGAQGALVAADGRRARIPPHPVAAVDATGAGDAFGGAFMARLVAGDDAFAAARYAAVTAALSTRGYGAVAPVPRAGEVEAALNGA